MAESGLKLSAALWVAEGPGNLSKSVGLHIAFAASIALAQITCSYG